MKRKELVNTLTLVGNALANNDLVAMFQCFCFDEDIVSAYNDALGIVAPCKTPRPFAVNGPVLLGLLGHSLAEDVDFNVTDEAVIVKAGKSNFKLPYHPKADFLFDEPEVSSPVLLAIDDDLLAGITACLQTSSTDNAQPAFMGICLHYGVKNYILYSTDGDAVSRYQLDARCPADSVVRRILPNSFCSTLIKIMDETGAKSGKLQLDHEWAAASLETGYAIYGRLIQVDSPLDYEKEIGKTIVNKAMAFAEIPKGLALALKRARVLSDPESAKTTLAVESKKLKLLTETAMGVVRDAVPINHPDMAANVSAQLIQRCVEQCSHMLIRDNCVEFWGDNNKLYILTSNMGD